MQTYVTDREAELIGLARGGDERAYGDLVGPHRPTLHAHCYRMLGSLEDADDALQESLLRAWRGLGRFEGRSSVRTWLYRIATNCCLQLLKRRPKRLLSPDYAPPRTAGSPPGRTLPESAWLGPYPDEPFAGEDQTYAPAASYEHRETVELAFVAALQHLPPRQRAVLILCEVLRWKATEVAELLDTTVPSVNSALQRARATLDAREVSPADAAPAALSDADRALLARYVEAFQRYDMEALTALIHEDATQSMPPFDLWLRGREDILAWWAGPGIGCSGSRVLPAVSANGSPAFAQYKPSETGSGYDPWALQVLEIADGRIAEFTFFLSTDTLFPLWGLPPRLES
jgi:RNA polymerase sigma-70 factor (ECF subfamily)